MKPSYSFSAYLLLSTISMFIIKDWFDTPHGIIILIILAISSFMALYTWLNWNRGVNRYKAYIGWYIFTLYCVTVIFLPAINLKTKHALNTALLSLLLCVATGILIQSIMVFRYVRNHGLSIPSGDEHSPSGSNGKSLTLKDSLKLLSGITGIPKILLPDDARQISETCFYYPSAISIVGNIIKKNPDKWTLLHNMLINPDREKYASCSEENRITFPAIEIALSYFVPWPIRTLFHKLLKYDVDEKLIPPELAKALDETVEDIETFLSYTASMALLRYEDGFYYLTSTSHDYVQFHKKDYKE